MPSSIQVQRIHTTATNPITATTTATVNHHHKQLSTTTIWKVPSSICVPEDLMHHHTHAVGPHQCSSAVVQSISATVDAVWSVVRRFDNPQAYKHFLKSCDVILGDGDVGTLREVHVVSGLPAGSSTERLEILDDDRHVMSFSVVGGDHRLNNYRSVTTLHPSPICAGTTVVVESYVVDVPPENTKEETCVFVDTIVRCNMISLKQIAENLAKKTNSK
ncbi:abscisic acid receptor PYL4-like [Cynara cardunculus var. scolymus]|nr:abscisic acid receptor PYL4-like [Cynara cardunculus var. scolymus]